MPRKPKLFISHSSTDTAVAQQIDAALRNRFETFLDAADIQPGADWQDMIETAIADCDAAIVLLSPAVAARAFWVSNEAFVLAFRRGSFPEPPDHSGLPARVHPSRHQHGASSRSCEARSDAGCDARSS